MPPAPANRESAPRLVRRGGDGETLGAFVVKARSVIGRHPQSDLVVAAQSVSRRHAQIEQSGGAVVLTDLGSSNGTFVNGERVQRRTLRNGDRVSFGEEDFVFQEDPRRDAARSWISAVDVLDEIDTEHTVIAHDAPSDNAAMLKEMARELSGELELRSAHARLATLYGVCEVLRNGADSALPPLFEDLIGLLFDELEAERGVVLVRRPEDGLMEPAAARVRGKTNEEARVTLSRTVLDRVVRDRVAILSSDMQMDERFSQSESISMSSIRSAICAPFIVRGEVAGVVHLDSLSRARLFTDDDLKFLSTVAGEIAVTIENRLMREEAVHRERLAAVGETLAGISHSAKNLLTMVGAGAEVLSQSIAKKDWEGVEDSWGVVQRGLGNLEKLTREMLELSVRRKALLEEVDINELAEGMAGAFRASCQEAGIALRLDLEEHLGPRATDREGLSRVLENLVLNAIEAMKHGGEIVLTTRERPGGVLDLTVYDNGPGIAEEDLREIFKPFFTTKGNNGTGLGLPMCRKIAEDLGGRLTVDSTVGKGSAFTVSLPLIRGGDSTEFSDTKI